MILSPTLFVHDICVTLEAVIIAGSVKENCCSNMPLLSVVTGKCFSDTELAFSVFVFHADIREAKFAN